MKDIVQIPDCGHFACSDCFKDYINSKIDAGADSVHTACVGGGEICGNYMPEEVFKKYLTEENYVKYKHYLVTSFCHLCPTIKYCPKEGCGKAAENPTGDLIEIHCDCDTRYCFGCGRDPHFPISCVLLQDWAFKTDDCNEADRATMIWLKS